MAALRHRGPDSEGVWKDEHVHLEHTRLKIIDQSDNAAQPMRDAATGVVIVYNGEIYNYRELRAELPPGNFFSNSDTEVVLRLYLRHGIGAVERLRGMFAFAIWDPRDRVLHLARDRFGIKPLFVHQADGALVFGSEIKSVMALGIEARLNKQVVADYLLRGHLGHTAETFFDPIRAAPAATVLSFRNGELTSWRYWKPCLDMAELAPEADVEEQVWDLLKESLALHLVSDTPVGVSLSAGLDSQLITRLLAKLGCGELHAFTFGFDEAEYDEVRVAARTEFELPLARHEIVTRPADMLETLEQAMGVFEAPLGGLGTLSAYRLMQRARSEGVPVLLTGEGSDEAFGGYKYYYYAYFRDLYAAGETDLLERELSAFARTNGEVLGPDSALIRGDMPDDGQMRAPDGTAMGGTVVLGPDLAASVRAPVPRRSRHGHLRAAMSDDLNTIKLPKLLWFQDRASMAWGVEARVPFLDHKLIECVARLPARWFIRDGVSKYLPKRLLRRFCGVQFGDTPKRYVATPQREWLKGPLFSAVADYLDDGVLAGSKLIDYDDFRRAYVDYAAHPELGNSFFVWKVINLESLLRRFFPSGADARAELVLP